MTDLAADTPLVDRLVPSPNHNARRDGPLDMLVLHYTGMATGEAALARLCDPASSPAGERRPKAQPLAPCA